MRLRTAVLAAGLVVAALAAPSSAAPACNLEVDPADDTFLVRYQDSPPAGQPVYGPQEDSLDIVSADIASNGKVITAVIRVKNLAAAAATSPGGRGYDFTFTTSKTENVLFMRGLNTTAKTFEVGFKEPLPVGVTTLNTVLGTAEGVFDDAKNEVRVTAPLSAFDPQGGIKAGDKIAIGEITTGRVAGPRTVFSDVVVGTKSYKIGDKNCVTPGK